MVSRGLLVRMEINSGMDGEVEELFRSVLPMVRQEVDTIAWYGVRFGRSDYGVVAAFPGEQSRDAHHEGSAFHSIMKAGSLCTRKPSWESAYLLSYKLSEGEEHSPDAKGMMLRFKAKGGHEEDVEEFLLAAAPWVRDEPRTAAWFSLRFENGEYGIFAAFPDNGGRLAHLTGHVMRELAKHPLSFLGGFPELDLVSIVAEKTPGGR